MQYQAIWQELKPFGVQEPKVFHQDSANQTGFTEKAVAYNELFIGGVKLGDQGEDKITAFHTALVALFSNAERAEELKRIFDQQKVTRLTEAMQAPQPDKGAIHKAAFEGLFLQAEEMGKVVAALQGMILLDLEDLKAMKNSSFLHEFAAADTLTLQALRKQVKKVEPLSQAEIEQEIITSKKVEFIQIVKDLKDKCSEDADKVAFVSGVFSLLARPGDSAAVQTLMFTNAFDEKVQAETIIVAELVDWKLAMTRQWINEAGSTITAISALKTGEKEFTRLAFREMLMKQTKFFGQTFDEAAIALSFNFKADTFANFNEIMTSIEGIQLFDSKAEKKAELRLIPLLTYLSEVTTIEHINPTDYAAILLQSGDQNIFHKLKVASESILLWNLEECKTFVPAAFASMVQKWNPYGLVEELEFVKEPKADFKATQGFFSEEETVAVVKSLDLKAFKASLVEKGIDSGEKLQAALDLVDAKSCKCIRNETLASIYQSECKEADKTAVLKKIFEFSLIKVIEQYEALSTASPKALLFNSKIQFALWYAGGLFKDDQNVLGKAMDFKDFSLGEATAVDLENISAEAAKVFGSTTVAIQVLGKFIESNTFKGYFEKYAVNAKADSLVPSDNLTIAKLTSLIGTFTSAIVYLHYDDWQKFIAGTQPAFYTSFLEANFFDLQAANFSSSNAANGHEWEFSTVWNELASNFDYFSQSADKAKYWKLFDDCAELDSIFMNSQEQAEFAKELAKIEKPGNVNAWWALVLELFSKKFIPSLKQATKEAKNEQEFIASLEALGKKAKNAQFEAFAEALAKVSIYDVAPAKENAEAFSVAFYANATSIDEFLAFLKVKGIEYAPISETLSKMTAKNSLFRLRNQKDFEPTSPFENAQQVAAFVVPKLSEIMKRLEVILLQLKTQEQAEIQAALETLWKPSQEAEKLLASNFFFLLRPVDANKLEKSIMLNYLDLFLDDIHNIIGTSIKVNKKFIARTSNEKFIKKQLKLDAQLAAWLAVLDDKNIALDVKVNVFEVLLESASGFLKVFTEAYANYKQKASQGPEKSDSEHEPKSIATKASGKKQKEGEKGFLHYFLWIGSIFLGSGLVLVASFYIYQAWEKNSGASLEKLSV